MSIYFTKNVIPLYVDYSAFLYYLIYSAGTPVATFQHKHVCERVR